MPKWWPWGRSKQQAAEPAAPARRAEPGWHRVPAIQRTVGEIDSTTRLSEFTASLTTSHNPGLTGSLDLLAAGHPERLPVLDAVRDATAASTPPPPVAAPARQSRTWSPSPAVVQRALRDLRAPVQCASHIDIPSREIHPVEPQSLVEPQTESLIDAPQPPADRVLDVISGPGFEEPPAAPGIGSTSVPSVAAPPAETATRLIQVDEPASTADDPVTLASAVGAGESSSPPAPPTTVQRAVTEPTVAVRRTLTPESMPVVPPMDSRSHRDEIPHLVPAIPMESALSTSRDTGSARDSAVSSGAPLQRTGVADAVAADTGDAVVDAVAAVPPSTEPPAPPMFATAGISDRMLPVVPSRDHQQPIPAITPVAVQRSSAGGAESRPTPTNNASNQSTATAATWPPVRAQRLPVGDTLSFPTVSGTPSHHAPPTLPIVQRSAMAAATPAVRPSRSSGTTSARPEAQVHIASEPHLASPPTPAVARRLVPPAVEPADAPAAVEPLAPQRHSEAQPARVAQRMTTGGRLVILPPVRSSRGPSTPVDTPQASIDSVIFESRRPMSLQRMFEHTAAIPTEDSTETPTGARAPSAAIPTPEVGATTITVPNVQGDPEPEAESAPLPPSAPVQAATTASAAAAADAPPAEDVEEMVNRLYDPLAARLRAELWLDRERAGALMDLGR